MAVYHGSLCAIKASLIVSNKYAVVIFTDLEALSLRICLFIFSFPCDFAFNALFYFNDNISDRYHYEGDNLYLFGLVVLKTICLNNVNKTEEIVSIVTKFSQLISCFFKANLVCFSIKDKYKNKYDYYYTSIYYPR